MFLAAWAFCTGGKVIGYMQDYMHGSSSIQQSMAGEGVLNFEETEVEDAVEVG